MIPKEPTVTTPDPRYVVARKLHDLDCPAGAECRDEDMTWGRWYAHADAVLAAVEPVIRRQERAEVAEEIVAEIEALNDSWPIWPSFAAAIARSHSTQPTEEETTRDAG